MSPCRYELSDLEWAVVGAAVASRARMIASHRLTVTQIPETTTCNIRLLRWAETAGGGLP